MLVICTGYNLEVSNLQQPLEEWLRLTCEREKEPMKVFFR